MSKLRISIVEYLNTAPLVWGFAEGPLVGKYDLSFTVPSHCAEALRRGDFDVAIIFIDDQILGRMQYAIFAKQIFQIVQELRVHLRRAVSWGCPQL